MATKGHNEQNKDVMERDLINLIYYQALSCKLIVIHKSNISQVTSNSFYNTR